MRLRVVVTAAGTLLFSLAARPAFADMLPSFPDPWAPETGPLMFLGLLLALTVSGTSFLLLRRLQRAPEAAEPEAAETTVEGDNGTSDDSAFDCED